MISRLEPTTCHPRSGSAAGWRTIYGDHVNSVCGLCWTLLAALSMYHSAQLLVSAEATLVHSVISDALLLPFNFCDTEIPSRIWMSINVLLFVPHVVSDNRGASPLVWASRSLLPMADHSKDNFGGTLRLSLHSSKKHQLSTESLSTAASQRASPSRYVFIYR